MLVQDDLFIGREGTDVDPFQVDAVQARALWKVAGKTAEEIA